VLAAECGWRDGEDGAWSVAGAGAGDGEFVARQADVLEWSPTRVGYAHRRGDCCHALRFFGPQPSMNVSAIGYGAGTADLEGQPNVLRIMIGEAAEKVVPGYDQEITVIEANLDDMNPQIYGYFQEKALAAGALDVFTTPVQMKKNRPGTLLTVLCS